MTDPLRLGRRLADLRRRRDEADRLGRPSPIHDQAALIRRSDDLARQLALAVDGEWVRGPSGGYVRVEPPSCALAVDRTRLAGLPDGAPPDVPLICLDTETTGLATGAGTVAFLVGYGTWDGDRFRQVQLLMPDHADEPALLDALAAAIPPNAWLVTYNGRGFDWPLLVSRYRMSRRSAPIHAGHLDLLPFVRRVFRHRLSDARLRTVETELLGMDRGHDVDGWEIPGRYLDFLRGGSAGPLAEVVRHNHEDVHSLARLLAHAESRLGGSAGRRSSPAGDVAGLARAYRRLGRSDEALDCLEIALEAGPDRRSPTRSWTALLTTRADAPDPRTPAAAHDRQSLLVDRARLLRRLRRHDDALEAWRDIATSGGRWAALGWIEVAKILEHRRRDPVGALDACSHADRIAERARFLGRRLPHVEADLACRRRRLSRKVVAARGTSARSVARDAPPPRVAVPA